MQDEDIPNPRPSGDESRPPYPGFWQAVALLGAVVAIQFLILIPIAASGYRIQDEKDWRALAVQGPLLILSTLGALGIAATWPNSRVNDALKFPPLSPAAWFALGLFVVGAFLTMEGLQGIQIFASAGNDWLKKEFAEDYFDHLGLWPALAYGTLIAPLCEELLFRGVVLGGFLRRYPATRAILASALLFAAIHLTIPQLLGAFVAGGYLGWWRARTGGLTAPVALHALYNAVALVVTKVWGLPAIYYTQTGLWISLANLAGGALLLFGIVRLSNRFLPALDLPRAADREEAS